MKLFLSGHEDRYAIEQLQLCLFPDSAPEHCDVPFSGDGAVSALHRGGAWLTATAKITLGGRTTRAVQRLSLEKETYALRRRILQRSFYLAALPHLDREPPWGALSGVRPTKLTTRHLLAGGDAVSADALLRDSFFVTAPRRKLCIEASQASVKAASLLAPEDVSVYVGIPFCPTRCAYCSFVSQTAGSADKLLVPFLDCLLREVETVGALLRQSGRRVRTVYFGGGTPTTLSTAQISALMDAISAHLDLGAVIEYTVEGGRPDTLTPDKLEAIRARGATRMSINPQTMNDRVLEAVGRRHTTAQTVSAYEMARAAGFSGINMDLIAGLPTDTFDSFQSSVRQVLALRPSNITVHTLALKKGADLFFRRGQLADADEMAAMVDEASRLLREAGYVPYYLYRQKYMSGSFENVGWCRDGDLCLYNIYMMEELHSIISLGGAGMSKINLSPTRLQRFHNPKFPTEYIAKLDDVLTQKRRMFELLKGVPAI